MNYLGHCLLSGENERLLVGNFLGDFVKGKEYIGLASDIKEGIDLHRYIDHYTDSHSSFKQSKKLFGKYRHYSSVMVDLYFDHFLAREWSDHSDLSLRGYADWVYDVLEKNYNDLTTSAQFVIPHLRKNDWLFAYSERVGFEDVLKGMDRRSRFKSKMGVSYEDFLFVEKEMKFLFDEFIQDVKQEIISHKQKKLL